MPQYVPGDQIDFTTLRNAPSLQSFAPTTGGTVSISAAQSSDIFAKLTPAGTLVALTISLPAGDHVGQQSHIHSTQALTTVTFTALSGTVVGALTSWVINGFSSYYWDGTNWNRIG